MSTNGTNTTNTTTVHPGRPWLQRVERVDPATLTPEAVWQCRACGGAHEDPARLDPWGSRHAADCWFHAGHVRLVQANVHRDPDSTSPGPSGAPPSLPSPPTLEDILDRDRVRHGVTPKPYEWRVVDGWMALTSAEGVEALRTQTLLLGMMQPLAHAVEDRARLVELVAMLVATVEAQSDTVHRGRSTLRTLLGLAPGPGAAVVAALCERGRRLVTETKEAARARGLARAEEDLATGRVRRFVRAHGDPSCETGETREKRLDALSLVAERREGNIYYVPSPAHTDPARLGRLSLFGFGLEWDQLDLLPDAGYVEEYAEETVEATVATPETAATTEPG